MRYRASRRLLDITGGLGGPDLIIPITTPCMLENAQVDIRKSRPCCRSAEFRTKNYFPRAVMADEVIKAVMQFLTKSPSDSLPVKVCTDSKMASLRSNQLLMWGVPLYPRLSAPLTHVSLTSQKSRRSCHESLRRHAANRIARCFHLSSSQCTGPLAPLGASPSMFPRVPLPFLTMASRRSLSMQHRSITRMTGV